MTYLCISAQQLQKLTPYVRPLIGTEKMGHTFPGATVPFGAVQLSPETDTISYELNGKYNGDVYKYCAGYRYEDKTITGFSHTHFSGTGHSDLGDFLIMPTTGQLKLNPGTASNPESGYRSRFSHNDEISEAGYYKVKLQDYNILAELTATTRVGVHRYTFPKSDQAHIILDLMAGIYNYNDKNVWTYVRVNDDKTITGYRQTNGWARTRTVYFAMKFSKPFKSYGQKNYDGKRVYNGFWRKFDQNKNFPEIAGKQIRMYFDFDTQENEAIEVQLAISPVSQANAIENLEKETGSLSFEQVKAKAQEDWNKELNKIVIKGTEDQKVNFYTAMYHTFINPTIYMDANGEYKGLDQNIHKAEGFTNYTTFSLWDTYRALHPYFNIIQPKRNADMVKSMMAHYEQSSLKMLPIWSHYANENWCMSGYHSVSVIADAIIKGNYTGDAKAALMACVATANKRNYEGIGDYIDKGYIPAEKNGTSVSNTLEYSYDDWAIAQLAKHLGETEIYNKFIKRSENWRNNFDKTTGFMRPRMADGSFKKDFDLLSTHGQGFIEGNSWNYSFFVPHNPEGLIQQMGGKQKFASKLDKLFSMHLPDEFFADTEDITREGIIGGYVHGNEPAHHVAYFYNWSGQPWKTQKQVRHILEMQYKSTPDGLGGNDDTGQMSAWYILSSLGFYPVAPGSEDYAIGSPAVNNAVLTLENGKNFEIEAVNQSPQNVYVQKILLNGKEIKNFTLKHSDIMNGGKIVFYMNNKPKK
ncbi:sugar hydrolase [Elizabethkingia anophelis]|uniref:Sugar hydrolase n=1 Tax=Elizabethkingia anophelis R26 TaxID=1246994 RepID=A0ABN5BYJ3_9FLAO|nr:sugar hydrolase [Elizabethkingia anophelis R26]ATC41908.1 sugar hydrolase [Elizabethkingia anophelis Ag1]ATC45589.1 sugar hydrolase [Elizabethkingia anophelis]ATC49265.1 sugar hydrolase [Elizabethkingia anophelis]HAY3596587.1 glycoside hydrolase family 92 protein [Elizabethkingia anophelis]